MLLRDIQYVCIESIEFVTLLRNLWKLTEIECSLLLSFCCDLPQYWMELKQNIYVSDHQDQIFLPSVVF